MKTQGLWRSVALILVVSLLLGMVGMAGLVGGVILAPQLQGILPGGEAFPTVVALPTAEPPPPAPLDITISVDEEEQLIADIFRQVSPSVVHIQVVQRLVVVVPDISDWSEMLPLPRDFPGAQEFQEGGEAYQRGEGSGLMLDKEGHIVTNYHVVMDAEKVEVIFLDGTVARAKVVGSDPDSDLAVL